METGLHKIICSQILHMTSFRRDSMTQGMSNTKLHSNQLMFYLGAYAIKENNE